MYCTWLGAIPRVIVYCLGFRKFILTEEEEARFNALLNQQNQSDNQQ